MHIERLMKYVIYGTGGTFDVAHAYTLWYSIRNNDYLVTDIDSDYTTYLFQWVWPWDLVGCLWDLVGS